MGVCDVFGGVVVVVVYGREWLQTLLWTVFFLQPAAQVPSGGVWECFPLSPE